MRVCYKKVYLPHIHYTVHFKPFKTPPNSISTANGWVERIDKWGCNVYLSKKETPGGAAHELVHVLQYICTDRHMTFEGEFEHMAYIMQFLMGQLFDYSWVKRCQKRS